MRKSVLAATTVAIGVALAVPVTPARAAGPGPVIGDINGDGALDRIDLGRFDDTCTVEVHLGDGQGGFAGSPSRHAFPAPLVSDSYLSCPDMGTVADLAGDGTPELVVAGFYDGNGAKVLVLDSDFQPAAAYPGLFQPSYIGSGRFGSRDRDDIWQWTDQGAGVRILFSTRDGALVEGPSYSTAVENKTRIADLNGDGEDEIVMVRRDSSGSGRDSGLVVAFSGQHVVPLLEDPWGDTDYSYELGDVDGDGLTDVTTTATANVDLPEEETTTSVFLAVRKRRHFVQAPELRDDKARARAGATTALSLLDNDLVPTDAVATITEQPAVGLVEAHEDGTVTYAAPASAKRTQQSFRYSVQVGSRTDTATVSVRVR